MRRQAPGYQLSHGNFVQPAAAGKSDSRGRFEEAAPGLVLGRSPCRAALRSLNQLRGQVRAHGENQRKADGGLRKAPLQSV